MSFPLRIYRINPDILGFTLLEVLVVMVIIGIIATMAVISVGSREPSTFQEARRLTELLRLAAEEAILRGQEWGLRFTESGYEFMVLEGATWQTASDDILRPRQFPPELEPRLSIEGEELSVESPADENSKSDDAQHHRFDKEDKKKAITPQVLILSSGEVSSFQLSLYAHEQPTWRIIGDYGGNFTTLPLARQ
ncbi:general secretion pathway protein H [Gammaproteobacteria bacterium]